MAVHFANWRCLAVASSRAWLSVPPHNQCMQHCRKTPLVQQWPPLPLPWDYNRCYHQWSSKVWLHIARVNLLKWGFGCAGICSRVLCICLHWGSNGSGSNKEQSSARDDYSNSCSCIPFLLHTSAVFASFFCFMCTWPTPSKLFLERIRCLPVPNKLCGAIFACSPSVGEEPLRYTSVRIVLLLRVR